MAEKNQLIEMTAEIVSAHVSHNTVAFGDVPHLIQKVHEALQTVGDERREAGQTKMPAVSIRASVKPDYIVCMVCGRKQKALKRHLQLAHRLTPQQYRTDYGLPDNYPMAAPNYTKRRREIATEMGLGRKREGKQK